MKIKKAVVTANAFNRETGEEVSNPRRETIDLEKNELFQNCETILDIKKAYESFWNELNPRSLEIVFVSKVEIIK
jgi:hypothetical protein